MTRILLVLLCCCVATGFGVRLTDFVPVGMTPFQDSFNSYIDNRPILNRDAIYVNQSIVYFSIHFDNNNEKSFYVSVAKLTDKTWTHRRVNSPFDLNVEHGHSFTLNDRAFLMVTQRHSDRVDMNKLLVWENDQWRPMTGDFPYVLGRRQSDSHHFLFKSDPEHPRVMHVCFESVSFGPPRYDFHRLELTDGRVRMTHTAGLSLEELDKITFFTVRNDSLLAVVTSESADVRKFKLPIPNEPADIDVESPFTVEPVPLVAIGRGYQIDDFVVFASMGRHTPDLDLESIKGATVYNLKTKKVTETKVYLGLFAHVAVDERGKRLLRLNTDKDIEIATLLP